MPATTISLSDTNRHNLYDVLTGKDTSGASAGHTTAAGIPGNLVRFLELQPDSANGGTVGVGDASLSSTDMGVKLAATSPPMTLALDHPRIDLTIHYVIASAATQKLNVTWEY